jgi:hypothetical protein
MLRATFPNAEHLVPYLSGSLLQIHLVDSQKEELYKDIRKHIKHW